MQRELEALQKQKADLQKPIPTTMVMGELEKPRETFVLARGDYRNQTEKVQPGVPAMLPPLEAGAPLNRLTLAKWLVAARTSPHLARRGQSLLADVLRLRHRQDAGRLRRAGRAARPSRAPRLAGDRVRAHRLGHPRDAAAHRDVRDVSAVVEGDAGAAREGSRESAAGARAALPPAGGDDSRHRARRQRAAQRRDRRSERAARISPAGLWEELAFGDGFSAQTYEQSHGKDLYRRGMYTFWKRTAPPASLATFDAPDREKCTGRRALTNTPLQALVLLNDPTYVEAARALAQRTLLEGGKDENDRLSFAFRLATAREPTGKESGVLRKLLESELKSFAPEPAGRDQAARRRRVSARQALDPVRARGLDDRRERDSESRRDRDQVVSHLRSS